MKTLALVFQNADTPQVIDLMRRTFEEVFARSVQVEAYFMDRIGETEQICADVLVVNRTVSLLALRPHTPSFQNVVFMTRSIRKTYLDSILAIPAGTDVLLVNDTPDSAHEMIEMLYELGIGHLNLIPFEPDREAQGDYRSIQYAITPNEPQLVPARIPHVLNTEYRVVGFDTIINAAAVLNLTSDRIASNLIRLRLASGMTQAEVGEKLNYSDKAISKWERGDVTTDVFVLMQIADVFGVDVDYLLKQHNEIEPVIYTRPDSGSYTTKMITLVTILGIWTVALFVFVILWICGMVVWQVFVYAVPVSLITLLVLNSVWNNGKNNRFIIAALVLSIIATVYLTFLSRNLWQLFILAIPSLLLVFLGAHIGKKR